MCWQGWPTRRFCTRWSTAIGCRVRQAARAPSTRSCWSAGPRTRWSGQRLRRCSGSSRSSLCCPRVNIASQRWPCDDCDPRCMLQSDPTAPTLSSNFVRYRPIWVVSTVSRRWLYDDIHMRTHTHANLCSAKNHSENESEALSLCSLICCISDGVPPSTLFCQINIYTCRLPATNIVDAGLYWLKLLDNVPRARFFLKRSLDTVRHSYAESSFSATCRKIF